MSESQKAALRSFVITFLAVLVPALLAPDFAWDRAALVAVGLAALRTAVSAALPGGPFGVKPTR
jgi:hypothetical protein